MRNCSQCLLGVRSSLVRLVFVVAAAAEGRFLDWEMSVRTAAVGHFEICSRGDWCQLIRGRF